MNLLNAQVLNQAYVQLYSEHQITAKAVRCKCVDQSIVVAERSGVEMTRAGPAYTQHLNVRVCEGKCKVPSLIYGASGDEGRTNDNVLAGGWILPRGLEPGANFGIWR